MAILVKTQPSTIARFFKMQFQRDVKLDDILPITMSTKMKDERSENGF